MNNRIISEDFAENSHNSAANCITVNWPENLKITALEAPGEPGVYIMKDENGQIVYIGKAKSLKNRLKSYFSGGKDIKTATLLRHVKNIETIIVSNEYDALLLENTLIKQHSPKYNINLKDGKTYPLIRITHEDFPRIFRTRRIIEDKSQYYGPFPNVGGLDVMLEIIVKLFPLRKCKTLKKRGPCVYYHIDRCSAPCCGKISAEDYNVHVQRVQRLLSGETAPLVIDLTAQMHKAAKALQFEKAAGLRNTIQAIEKLAGENSSVVDHDPEGRDYIAWASEGVLATFTVFSMRGGKMTGQDLFRARSAANERESLELFITSYYENSRPPPPKIFLLPLIEQICPAEQGCPTEQVCPAELGSAGDPQTDSVLISWFREKFNFEPELITSAKTHPDEKRHGAILTMARYNAQEDLRKRLKERGAGPALDELNKALNLGTRPERIEGFDISQLDGKHPVASLVSFRNGIPDKKNYRYFKLRSVIGIVDDFAAMREVVRRRYSRLIKDSPPDGGLPDLILVDGGIGQVNAAKGVLDELGINIAIAGLAKRDEELWLPNAKAPVILPRQSEALKVLQFIRDESHRFATGFNQRLRSKTLFFPVLESVDGIGAKKAAAIMKIYKNIGKIAAADHLELAKACKISQTSARAVKAAAKLALEDQAAAQKRLVGSGKNGGTPSLAAEAAE